MDTNGSFQKKFNAMKMADCGYSQKFHAAKFSWFTVCEIQSWMEIHMCHKWLQYLCHVSWFI